ncbi:MAG: hypothetical protein ACE5HT_11870 [Gemmatimonadales bacterium]
MELMSGGHTPDRRSNDRRRIAGDRRRGGDRRGRDRRLGSDQDVALRLPDDFKRARGSTADRIMTLVNVYWTAKEEWERVELAQALIPILEDLVGPGAPVTESHRRSCQDIVGTWGARRA